MTQAIEAGYIKTSDGLYGVIVGETKNFIKVNMSWNGKDGYSLFSKQTFAQYGTPSRQFHRVEYSEVPDVV